MKYNDFLMGNALTNLLTFFNKIYGKCSKISNSFLALSSNKSLVIRAGIHNREDADQIDSSVLFV